ncbi:hypothetical protein GPECTOR_9g571 [Gonium pectorale]|uniref:Uncharacterized protein n=1 Tax=Gonium pectorale TaxID=33097 RepID=A0A150GRT5_GONPE|nr:hypothetical protein GPECTOR_9g571 [Gonium pectorale]|eukprot:KXZ52527.1 hypothetical protein GPECTOR_9g571 [Gonium pectorale]
MLIRSSLAGVCRIRLRLRRDWAPKACDAVARLANWGINGFYGPPYGLLQGGMPGLGRSGGVENPTLRPVKRGTAGFIGEGADYFIGTVDHSEWGGAFTVFAEVEEAGMAAVVPLIPTAPYRNSTDEQYHFTTRWLLTPVPYKLVALRREDLLLARGVRGGGGEGDAL